MLLSIPELSVVVLIGPSGSGKSTFARKHFKPTEILSSDYCRGLVSDDENDQAATNDAFDVLRFIARNPSLARASSPWASRASNALFAENPSAASTSAPSEY